MLIDGKYLVKPGEGQFADKLDIPTIDEFLDIIVAGDGKIFGCKFAMDMFGLEKEGLRDDVAGVLKVGEFYNLADAHTEMIFTKNSITKLW